MRVQPALQLRSFVTIGALAVAAAIALLLSTRLGIGVTPDSTAYLGFRPHDVGHAPLYSWLMRLGALIVPDVTLLARLYHAALYAGTAALTWHLLRNATGRDSAAWAGALLVAFTGPVLPLYSKALSEPTFVLLCVLAFGWLSSWADTRAPRYFAAAALAAALATLARYPGAALVATGALIVFVGGGGRLLHRLVRGALFGAIGLLPAVVWMAYVARSSGTAGGRNMGFAGTADADTFYQGLLAAARYVLPTEFPVPLRLAALAAALLLVAAATTAFYRRSRDAERGAAAATPHVPRHRFLPLILLVFVAAYFGVLVLGVLVEPFLPISDRYLYPAYVGLVLLGATTVPAFARKVATRRVLAFGVGAFIALGLVRTGKAVTDGYQEGWGYAALSWRSSPAVAYVKSLPPETAVYTDDPYALLYLTEHEVRALPQKVRRRLGSSNPLFRRDLDAMEQRLRSTDGVVVFFGRDRGEFVSPVLPDLERAMPLYETQRFDDAIVYALNRREDKFR